jgi:deoxyribonuclease V
MPFQLKHNWDISPTEARQVQHAMRGYVRVEPLPLSVVQRVAGVDVSYQEDKVYAAAVVMELPALDLVEQAAAEMPVTYPYIPGLLSFREAPGILSALGKLSNFPDVLIVDGHGLAHPRRFGIACHLGVLLDVPSIGCAKSLLIGDSPALDAAAGSHAELTHGGQVIGAALRTQENVKPIYISIGHRVDLESSIEIILACLVGYRLPEPIRRAHSLAEECRKSI